MSKLDNIVARYNAVKLFPNDTSDHVIANTFHLEHELKILKDNIKQLFLEIVGEDEDHYGDLEWPWGKERQKQVRDGLRQELRNKIRGL